MQGDKSMVNSEKLKNKKVIKEKARIEKRRYKVELNKME
jgi:hypothetical protein